MLRLRPASWGGCAGLLLTVSVCGGPAATPTPTRTTAITPAPRTAAAAAVVASPSPSTALGPASPVATEQPLTPEANPVGDIPDTQAFITYASASGGYQLQVPEGWARTETGTDVRFVDKLDGLRVALTTAAAAPTAASAQDDQVANLLHSGRAVQVSSIQDVQLPSGPAVEVAYSSNSEPDPVTGKQVRLENTAYLLYRGGHVATLTLWAPLGADNVDQWQQMVRSFQWR